MKTKKISTVIASSLMLATIIAGNLPANANEMTPEDTSYSWADTVNSTTDFNSILDDCIDEDEEDGSIDNPSLQEFKDMIAATNSGYGARTFAEFCEWFGNATGLLPTPHRTENRAKNRVMLEELRETRRAEALLGARLSRIRARIKEVKDHVAAAQHLAANLANLEAVDPQLYALDPTQADETNFLDEYKNDYLHTRYLQDIADLLSFIPDEMTADTRAGHLLLDEPVERSLWLDSGVIEVTTNDPSSPTGSRKQVISVDEAKEITTAYRERTIAVLKTIVSAEEQWTKTTKNAITNMSYYNKRLSTYLKNLNAELTARVEYFVDAQMEIKEGRSKVYEKVMNPSDYQKNVLVPMGDMVQVIDDFNTLREALDGFVGTTLPPTGTESEIKKKAPTPGTFDTTGSPFRGMKNGVSEAIEYMDENTFIRGIAAHQAFVLPAGQATAYMNEKAPEVATALAKGIRISTLPRNHHLMPDWVKKRAAIMVGGTYVHPTQAASVKYSVTQLQLAWENLVAIEDSAEATVADIIKAGRNKLIPDPDKHMVTIDRARSNLDAALTALQAKIAGSLTNPARVVGRPTISPQCADLSFADVVWWDSCRLKVRDVPGRIITIEEVSDSRENFDDAVEDRVVRLRRSLPENSSNIEEIDGWINEYSLADGIDCALYAQSGEECGTEIELKPRP